MKGSAFGESIRAVRGAAREALTVSAVKNGSTPKVFASGPWKRVVREAAIAGKTHILEIFVAPDFLAIDDPDGSDPFYIGAWTTNAQLIADHFNSILPSRILSRAIHEAADIHVSLYAINPGEPYYNTSNGTPRDIEHSGAFIASNRKRNASIYAQAGEARWSKLVAGHMKDIITNSKGLGGACPSKNCVTIYGGEGGTNDGWAIQPKSTVHDWNYGPDYSHGIRLVSRQAILDGKTVDLVSVFTDPSLHVLVSDEGAFDPRLPPPAAGSGGSAPPKDGSLAASKGPNEPLLMLLAIGLGALAAGSS